MTTTQSPITRRLVRALVTSDVAIERRPALLVGGWASWQNIARFNPVRSSNGRKFITTGDEDGIETAPVSRVPSAGINRSAQDYVRIMTTFLYKL